MSPALEGEWKLAFADDGCGDWRAGWFMDGDTATVENTPEGLLLRAGPDTSDNGDSMVLWTRQSFTGEVRVEYEFTRLDREPVGVNILYLNATGTGEPPFDTDILAWTALRKRALMSLYFNHMNALHVSYAVDLPGSEGEYVRARRYPAPVGTSFQKVTEVAGTYWRTGLFVPEVPYLFSFHATGSLLRFTVRGNGREQDFAWDLTAFPPLPGGRVGLRLMPGRISRIRNVQVFTR